MDEIVEYPNRTEDIKKYHHYFQGSIPLPAFNGLTLMRNTSSDEDVIGLFNKTDLVSVLMLNVREHGLWQITYAQTQPNFRGQGCFRYLLIAAVKTHKQVLSDERQTPLSKQAWISLIQHPGSNLNIYVYDIKTKKQLPAKDVPVNDIWNDKDDPVLMVTFSSSNQTDRNSIMAKLKESTGIDRTDEGIWYGPNSSTDSYFNP